MQTKLFATLLAVLGACSSTPSSPDVTSGRTGDAYVFTFLETGPARPSEEVLRGLMLGHFENMGRMARAGQLLLAGPFVEPRVEASLRGLFAFDTTHVDEAEAWVATDPAVSAGVLAVRSYPFTSDAPLRELPRLDREDEARRLAEDPSSQWQGRSYVLVTSEAADALAGQGLGGRVCFSGAFGGELAGTTLQALDVADLAELEALAPNLGTSVVRHPWYGTRMVAELPR